MRKSVFDLFLISASTNQTAWIGDTELGKYLMVSIDKLCYDIYN